MDWLGREYARESRVRARQVVEQAINELRRAIQVGDFTSGAYREINRFDRRLVRLETQDSKTATGHVNDGRVHLTQRQI